MTRQFLQRFGVSVACCALLLGACAEKQQAIELDAQVIVVGAGLSGLSAAVEMGRSGVDVLVVDMNSVAGGHTMLAGGVAMVATPLQARLGIEDTADLAYQDWIDWTQDGDPEWTRFYVDHSRAMIYDWVTDMGVEFVRVAPGHGNSVPRFHFTRGRASHLVLPIFRTALEIPSVSFRFNSRAEQLLVEDGRVTGVEIKDLRSGEVKQLRADNVILATGGFEADVERVLANWISGLPMPDRLLIGSAISATGSGHDMATEAGAALANIDRHYIYINGLIDPRDPQQRHSLTAGNDQSLWVNASGQRFTNEIGFEKDILVDLLQQKPTSYWMIFDEAARESFGVRGATWLKNQLDRHPILDDPRATSRAQTLHDLAAMAGLPGDALMQSVQEFNAMVDAGEDAAFGRFAAGEDVPQKIQQPSFYAIRMFPVTRKNMGGVAVDRQLRALDASGAVLPGLYAVGELNGSLGINGKYGLDGMFLGPAIISGRIAGQSIAAATPATMPVAAVAKIEQPAVVGDWLPTMTQAQLDAMLQQPRDGYWHFQVSHQLVVERDYSCTTCHSAQLPFSPVRDRSNRLRQTEFCTTCH